jgi:hypothetical protein
MEIKEFGRIMAREVGDKLGEGVNIEYNEVLKNNGVIYHALTIRKEGQNVAPTIYIDQLFECYKKGNYLMGLVDDVVDTYRKYEPSSDVDVEFFCDFSKGSNKLFFKVVNYDKNRLKLEDVPIKRCLDLALVPLVKYKSVEMGCGTITISKKHLEHWEISEEELWENVFENAPSVEPSKISGMLDILSGIPTYMAGADELSGLYVVTNKGGLLGASVMFYPGVLKGLAKDFESNLYIIPSSIHEVIIIPENHYGIEPDFLNGMIREVNSTTVAEEEVLSDNLYLYDREKGEVKLHIC